MINSITDKGNRSGSVDSGEQFVNLKTVTLSGLIVNKGQVF